MYDYLSAVGFPCGDQAELSDALTRAGSNPAEIIRCPNGEYRRWASGQGAEVWVQFDQNQNLIGATPFFQSQNAFKLGLSREIKRPGDSVLEGAVYGFRNPAAFNQPDEWQIIVFDLVDKDRCGTLKFPFVSPVNLCGLACQLNFYDNDEEYRSANADSRYSSEAFFASLVLQADKSAPPSTACINGHLLEHSLFTNPLTGRPYYWMKVKTYLMDIDVLCGPELITRPLVNGGVVSGEFRLVGKILKPRLKKLPAGES